MGPPQRGQHWVPWGLACQGCLHALTPPLEPVLTDHNGRTCIGCNSTCHCQLCCLHSVTGSKCILVSSIASACKTSHTCIPDLNQRPLLASHMLAHEQCLQVERSQCQHTCPHILHGVVACECATRHTKLCGLSSIMHTQEPYAPWAAELARHCCHDHGCCEVVTWGYSAATGLSSW